MPTTTRPARTTAAGFTLIELMVTVAIVAILATIAVTSYSSQVQKSRRTDARSALLDLAGREEKLFSTTNAYANDPYSLGYGAQGSSFPVNITNSSSGTSYYQVSVAIGTPPVSFTVTATPINSQVNDTACTSLSIDQTGTQSYTGSGSHTDCWGN